MTVRFLADEDFDHKTLAGVRRHGRDVDIVAVQEVGLIQAPDPVVLEWAAREGRIVVSRDVRTMERHAYDRVEAGLPMPRVIEIPYRVPRAVVIEQLILIVGASDADE